MNKRQKDVRVRAEMSRRMPVRVGVSTSFGDSSTILSIEVACLFFSQVLEHYLNHKMSSTKVT